MNATEPTYFLYSGRLFHETAPVAQLLAQLHRSAEAASSTPQPRGEDPGPEGPEGEPVGEEEDEDEGEHDAEKVTSQREQADEPVTERKPIPGPGMPIVPEHGSPDANPIDPRVF